jgi:hypothetical protein
MPSEQFAAIMKTSIGIRRARQADGPAIFALIWSARREIPLKESFYSEDNKVWLTKECRRKVLRSLKIPARQQPDRHKTNAERDHQG